MITVGDRGQRDKWVNRKLNQVIILSGVRVKVGKKAVQAARQGDGQECGQEDWKRDRQEEPRRWTRRRRRMTTMFTTV